MLSRSVEVIDLAGDAFTRGCSLGSVRRAQIQSCISDWFGSLRSAGVADPEAYLAQMLRDTDFLAAIRRHAPDLVEEVRGIAEGAGQPFELLLAEQLMDEEWAYRGSVLKRAELPDKCSSTAIHARAGLTWIGQNMDLGGYTDGHQVLLRIAPHDPECGALIFTVGGMIALMGVNAHGVGVCVNALPQLPTAREGLPVAFVIRKLLQARTAEQAAQTASGLPHASGQHYLVADCERIRSFEASAAGVREYRLPDPHRVVHTNHPLAEEKGTPYPQQSQINTEARLRSLTARLMQGSPDLGSIKAALSSGDDPEHPVCRISNPQGKANPVSGMVGFTTGSMISTLERGAHWIDSWVSKGPPCQHGYVEVRLAGATSRDQSHV